MALSHCIAQGDFLRRPRYRLLIVMATAILGCAPKPADPAPSPVVTPAPPSPAPVRLPPETVTVRDPELERRVGRLELQLWERDAQVSELEERLGETRQEVVRAMAKLQSLATRAEAASGMAEADVALQAWRSAGAQSAEARQATMLMDESSRAFQEQNYGGALYLANQAKAMATQGRRQLAGVDRGAARAGETAFSLPLRLKATGRGNVREGPGTSFAVVFTAESGTALTGLSHVGDWVRVTAEDGRAGWISRALVARR